jgi:anti-anti-sigma regulatory factor
MKTPPEQYLICERPSSGIRVVRFIRPEYRSEIYDYEPVTQSSLYRALHKSALADLGAGETLVINFGLIEWFPSRFYSLLLAVREAIRGRDAHLLLCCLTPIVREGFNLLRGSDLFEVRDTEAEAISEAKLKSTDKLAPRGTGQ